MTLDKWSNLYYTSSMTHEQTPPAPALAWIIPYIEFLRRLRLRDDIRKARTLDLWGSVPVRPVNRRPPRFAS